MINIILQIWDLGGQERFEFMKEQYLKGAGVVGLCFDLSRPESFQKLNGYLEELRTSIGEIPILLLGNKQDLELSLGETISKEEIDQWIQTNHILDFIKTSAKDGINVDEAFKKLAILALKGLKDKPRPGQYKPESTILIKVVFIGAGGVGKTSLIHRYIGGIFAQDYKLTIGVDFLTKQIDIDENELVDTEIIEKLQSFKAFEEARQGRATIEDQIEDMTKGFPIEDKPSEELSESDEFEEQEELLDKNLPTIPTKPKGKAAPLERDLPSQPLSGPPPGSMPSISGGSSVISDSRDNKAASPSIIPAIPMKDSTSINKDMEYSKSEKPEYFAKEGIREEKKEEVVKEREREMKKASKDENRKDKALDDGVSTPPMMTESKLLHRKTTVFYRKQMNPFTLNKLSVVLSTVQIYEQLKNKIVDAERAASGKTLEIKEISPFIQVEPYFPGCVCVPAMIPLDARLDSTTADFQITPLATGRIPEASVRLYYEGKLIDVVKTPTKVVKQTAAKISATITAAMPVFGPLFDSKIGDFLQGLLSTDIWNLIGGIEGFFLILSGISALFGSISYFLKKPKEAQPVEANFPELEAFLKNK